MVVYVTAGANALDNFGLTTLRVMIDGNKYQHILQKTGGMTPAKV